MVVEGEEAAEDTAMQVVEKAREWKQERSEENAVVGIQGWSDLKLDIQINHQQLVHCQVEQGLARFGNVDSINGQWRTELACSGCSGETRDLFYSISTVSCPIPRRNHLYTKAERTVAWSLMAQADCWS
mmetsp:Transcript_22568/g.45318  ORF Transcript_22568/g.45318 Transcript_22568/m.45318 type:complete len:129 (-) Transcript_22568:28-414(-)